jgi:hypothetical protein
MRRCAQSSQRSTCPPSAAVRQRSIADMTLSWPRLTWPAWDARQAGPRWRKMSATSTAGALRFYDNAERDRQHALRRIQRRRARSIASWAVVPWLIATAAIFVVVFCIE